MPPDGGYGWVIVGGYVTNMACSIQLIQMMGLILKDVFKDLEFSDSQGATVIALAQAVSFSFGLLAGPLIRRYGFRSVAAGGAVVTTAGLALTSRATSFLEYVLYYGLLMASGMSMTYPSFIVALNTYFKARRTLATAVAMFFTGVAAVLTPLLISTASSHFGPNHALLVLAGVVLHTLVAAVLLRPLPSAPPGGTPGTALRGPHTMHEKDSHDREAEGAGTAMLNNREKDIQEATSHEKRPRGGTAMTAARGLVAVFDLGLLRSPAFVNLVAGTSLGLFTDINLLQFLPFILGDMGFPTGRAAVFMSVMGVADAACRLAAPVLHRACKRPSRVMYVATLLVLMATRTGLLFCRSYSSVMTAMVLIGASRGFNVVFLQLLIPDSVPIQRLPNAQGIFLLTNGIVFMSVGPVMGWLVGRAKDYGVVILVLVAVNILTLFMWGVEKLLAWRSPAALPS